MAKNQERPIRPSFQGKTVVWLGCLLLVVLGSAGGYYVWTRRAVVSAPQAPVVAAPKQLILPAQLQAVTVLSIPAPISGTLENVSVKVGDDIYEGQLLAQIKSGGLQGLEEAAALDLEKAQNRITTLEAALSTTRLEASRAAADSIRIKDDYERAAKLYEAERLRFAEGATPRLKYEKAERDFRSLGEELKTVEALAAQSEERISSLTKELDTARKLLQTRGEDIDSAREQLVAGDIVAPVSGILVSFGGEAGKLVNTAVRDLFVIASDISVLQAVADLPAANAQYVKEGQVAYVSIAEAPDALFPGTVKKLNAGRVIVEFPNPNPEIKPGLNVQIRIEIP